MAKRGGFPGGLGMPGNMNNLMKQADEASQELMGKMTGGLGGGFPF